MIALEKDELQTMKNILSKFTDIKKAVLFGSRALGTNKKTSDIDLALFGKIDVNTLSKIKYELEENTNIPYFLI